MKKVSIMIGLMAALGLGSLGFSTTASAKENIHKSCKADVEKFCKDVKPGEGRIGHCLREHRSELSEECKERIKEVKEEYKSCSEDREKFCKDVQPGEGRIRKCLKEHKSDLSKSCRHSLEHHSK